MVFNLCMCAHLLQLCWILCDPIDYSPPGSSVLGILQARILEWVASYFSKLPHRAGIMNEWSHSVMCPTLCDPMDCSLSGSSVHGIFQARVLEWIAISFSRGSSWPRDRTQVSRITDRRFTIWANLAPGTLEYNSQTRCKTMSKYLAMLNSVNAVNAS